MGMINVMDNSIYKMSLQILGIGFGYHKIILDEYGCPCDYEFLEANPALGESTGLQAEEMLGKRASEVLPIMKEENFDWIRNFGEVALNGTEIEFERYTVRLDKWYRICAFSPEKNHFITLITDITKEKEEFFKVERSEEKWKSYSDSAPYAILVADKSGKILEANLETSRISGYTGTELLNMSITEIFAQTDKEKGLRFLASVMSEGKYSCDMQLKTKQYGVHWYAVGARKLMDDCTIMYFDDIHDRKKLEENLTKSEQLYRTFIDASEDIITLKDEELRYIIVNDTLTNPNYFNRTKDEILGKTDAELLIDQEVKLYGDSDRKVLETKAVNKSEEWLEDWVFAAVKFPVAIGDGKIGVGAIIRDVTTERRQEAQIKRTMERHRILAETLLKTFKSKQEQLEYALHEALDITGSQYGYIFLYDELRDELTLNSWTIGVMESCGVNDAQMKYRLDQTGLWGEVIRQRKPIIFNNFEAPNPMKKGYPGGHIHLKNFMSIPVILGEKIVATVGLGNKNSGFDDNDVYELSMLMNGIFLAVEKEKAFEEIKYLSYHDHLTGIYNRRYFDLMLKELNSEKNMPLTVVMADVNGLKLVNDSFGHTEGDKLLQKAAEIITEGCRKKDIIARIGGDEFGIILPNTDEKEAKAIVKRIKKMQSTVIIKQLALSLSFGFAVKIEVNSDMGGILSEAENLMYRNKMYESASIRNKTISIIMNTLFEKSRREMEHSNRVSAIAGAIAVSMGLDAEQVNQIEVAGLLHDIGKIGIDEQILNKSGRLDSLERQEIMKHPEAGWRILSNSDEFSDIADFILHHHEFYNGCGYPRRIKGERIPLQSRIIAVADAYDAMTKDRPYRKGMSKEEAIAEMSRNSSIQFDPKIVKIFITNVLSSGHDFDFANENKLYQRIIKSKGHMDRDE